MARTIAVLAVGVVLLASCGSDGGESSPEALAEVVVRAAEAGGYAAITEVAHPGYVEVAAEVESTFGLEEGVWLTNWCYVVSQEFVTAASVRVYADAHTGDQIAPWTAQFPVYRVDGSWWAGFGHSSRDPDRTATSVDPDLSLPPPEPPPRPDDCIAVTPAPSSS
jgi:hypothetical protein